MEFNTNGGVDDNQNSRFNKAQSRLHTGLSNTPFSQQKIPFTSGPYIYDGPTSLSDKGLYGGKHFSFLGIQTEILCRNNNFFHATLLVFQWSIRKSIS